MDRHSALDYVEKGAAQSIADTKEFIKYVRRECCDPIYATTVDDTTVLSPPLSPRSRHPTNGTPDSSLASLPPPLKISPTSVGVTSPMSPSGSSSVTSPGSPPKAQDYHYTNRNQGTASKQSHRSSVSSVNSATSTARSQAARHAASALVQPILTPRFAISCSDALMAGLQAMVGKGAYTVLLAHIQDDNS